MYACDSGHRTSLYISFMSVSVEGVSALVAEFVGVRVLDLFLAAVGTLVDLVHTRQIDELRVPTAGAVVRGEELVESLHHVRDECGGVRCSAPLVEDVAEDADSEVTLVFVICHECVSLWMRKKTAPSRLGDKKSNTFIIVCVRILS